MDGLRAVFYLSAAVSLIAAFASLVRPEPVTQAASADETDVIDEGAFAVGMSDATTSIIEEDEQGEQGDQTLRAAGAANPR